MKILAPLFSTIVKFVSGALTIALISCAPKMASTPEEQLQAAIVVDQAKSQFGEVSPHLYKPYIEYVVARLSDALERAGREPPPIRITILNTSQALAYSPGAGEIVVSRGLVSRLQTESEFAFVVGHELAHLVFHHDRDVHSLESASKRQDLEREADKFAVGLIAAAGYNPYYARSGLLHAYGSEAFGPTDTPDGGYPGLYARLDAMRTEIMESGWEPPGTIDRRDFQKLRHLMIR